MESLSYQVAQKHSGSGKKRRTHPKVPVMGADETCVAAQLQCDQFPYHLDARTPKLTPRSEFKLLEMGFRFVAYPLIDSYSHTV